MANETYSAPKTFSAKAVAIEEFRVFTKFVPIKTVEIKELLRNALTSEINNRTVYMKGIDASYNYEGYFIYKTGELKK